jgi:hypothetical protein
LYIVATLCRLRSRADLPNLFDDDFFDDDPSCKITPTTAAATTSDDSIAFLLAGIDGKTILKTCLLILNSGKGLLEHHHNGEATALQQNKESISCWTLD